VGQLFHALVAHQVALQRFVGKLAHHVHVQLPIEGGEEEQEDEAEK